MHCVCSFATATNPRQPKLRWGALLTCVIGRCILLLLLLIKADLPDLSRKELFRSIKNLDRPVDISSEDCLTVHLVWPINNDATEILFTF